MTHWPQGVFCAVMASSRRQPQLPRSPALSPKESKPTSHSPSAPISVRPQPQRGETRMPLAFCAHLGVTPAPKGRNPQAQGNSLGNQHRKRHEALKGRHPFAEGSRPFGTPNEKHTPHLRRCPRLTARAPLGLPANALEETPEASKSWRTRYVNLSSLVAQPPRLKPMTK